MHSNDQTAAAELQEIQRMAPKRVARGMKETANSIMAKAEEFVRQVADGAPLVDTVQTMSAQVLHTGPMDSWRVTTMHGQAAPPTFEKTFCRPATTEKPCMHCAEHFDGRPVMVFMPHIDDPRGPPIGDGNWCSSACMMGFYRERRDDHMFSVAVQSARMQQLQTEVVAPAAASMRHWLGPHKPQREQVPALPGEQETAGADAVEGQEEEEEGTIEDQVVKAARASSMQYNLFAVREYRGRFRPASVLWHHRPVNAQQPRGQLQHNMVSMVFADTSGEVKGLQIPRGDGAPAPLQPRIMQKKGLFDEFSERVAAGEDPDKIELTVEARTSTTRTNMRRTRVGRITDPTSSAAAPSSSPTNAQDSSPASNSTCAAEPNRIALSHASSTAAQGSPQHSSPRRATAPDDVALQVALLPRAERKNRRKNKRKRSGDGGTTSGVETGTASPGNGTPTTTSSEPLPYARFKDCMGTQVSGDDFSVRLPC